MSLSQNACDLLCDSLTQLGVEVVFGVPGTQSVILYESMRKAKFRTITASSELGALFMANGYYRASGRPGVAVTIAGPGFSLGLTGLAEANNDSVALLQIVCSFPKKEGKSFQLQELDIAGVSALAAKSVKKISSVDELQDVVADSFRETLSGEPCPVVLEFPVPVMKMKVENNASKQLKIQDHFAVVDKTVLGSVVKRLSASRKPVLFVGQGGANSAKEIVALAEILQADVISNCSGHGIVSDNHHLLVCSDFSGWGVEVVNDLLDESDCVLVLGAKLSHNGTSGFRLRLPKEKTIHIDSSSKVLNRNYPVELALEGNLTEVLPMMLKELAAHTPPPDAWKKSELAAWKNKISEKRMESVPRALKPGSEGVADLNEFFIRLRKTIPEDAILVTDSGLHQVLTRRLMPILTPRGLIVPSDFQSMGYGVGAAIGAALAAPNRSVVCIMGDGGLAMCGAEILTAVREEIDLMVIVFNDGYLGQIRVEQLKEFGSDHGTAVGNIDIQLFAESFGATYYGLFQDVDETLRNAVKSKGVRVVELPLIDTTHLQMQTLKRRVKNQVRNAPNLGKLLFMKRRLKKS